MSGDLVKNDDGLLPMNVVKGQYLVMQAEPEMVVELVEQAVGPGGLSPFKLERIKIPGAGGTVWTVPGFDEDLNSKSFEGIIIHMQVNRGYWKDPDELGNPPNCTSRDGVQGFGIRWEGDEPGMHDCSTCKFAMWESDPKGGKGQACKQKRAIFILREDSALPYMLMVPPTSLDAAEKYGLRLAGRGYSTWAVISSFTLESMKNAAGQPYSEVRFAPAKGDDGKAKLIPIEQVKLLTAYRKALMPQLRRMKLDLRSKIDNDDAAFIPEEPTEDDLPSATGRDPVDDLPEINP